MKKIPTLFEREWNGDRSRVVDKVHPDCGWVVAGEGVATRKLDGTCCMVRDGKLYKRREFKPTDNVPEGAEIVDRDAETGKIVGWMPVGEGPEDRWHIEAFENPRRWRDGAFHWPDGTYELLGPKVQGNPEGFEKHVLMPHRGVLSFAREIKDVPRTFNELRLWLTGRNIEGIVWHHPDGRMAKIKLRDFGLKRTPGGERHD